MSEQKQIVCAQCGSLNTFLEFLPETFPYATGNERVDISVVVPVETCRDCGFQGTGEAASEIRDMAVRKHLYLQSLEAAAGNLGEDLFLLSEKNAALQHSLATAEAERDGWKYLCEQRERELAELRREVEKPNGFKQRIIDEMLRQKQIWFESGLPLSGTAMTIFGRLAAQIEAGEFDEKPQATHNPSRGES